MERWWGKRYDRHRLKTPYGKVRRPLVVIALALAPGCQRSDGRHQAAPARDARTPAGAADATAAPPPARPGSLSDPAPGARRDVSSSIGSALRAAIGDLDGDGASEIVVADAEHLRVLDASGVELARQPVPGGIQVLAIADGDGDGRAEILAGWGMSREHRDALAQVTMYRLARGQLDEVPLAAPQTTRQEIAAIVPRAPGELLLAYFADKYLVDSVLASPGPSGWSLRDLAQIRMATAYAIGDVDGDRAPDLVVGRVYGDDQGVDGDAFVLRPDGARIAIPTTRGVRSVVIADVDGDGTGEVFLSDGWHQNYGKIARSLVTWARWQAGRFRAELIEDTAGQYTAGRLLAADLDGDGRPEIVSHGSHHVRVFHYAGGHWQGVTIAGMARDVAVGDLDGAPGDEVLVVADRSEVVSLPGTIWDD